MIIRNAEIADLSQIVAVHRSAFPSFLMTRLGPLFLMQYYRLVLSYPRRVFLVADTAGTVCGFVAGFVAPSLFYKNLKAAKWRLAMSAFAYLAIRPWLWKRVLSSYGQAGRSAAHDGGDGAVAELASLAVAPASKGRGYGQRLVREFNTRAGADGAQRVVLTTDAECNERVNSFYQGLGFRSARSFVAGGERQMVEYVYEITPVATDMGEQHGG